MAAVRARPNSGWIMYLPSTLWNCRGSRAPKPGIDG